MNCQKCGCNNFMVADSRLTVEGIIRRRKKCQTCGNRMTTYEVADYHLPCNLSLVSGHGFVNVSYQKVTESVHFRNGYNKAISDLLKITEQLVIDEEE